MAEKRVVGGRPILLDNRLSALGSPIRKLHQIPQSLPLFALVRVLSIEVFNSGAESRGRLLAPSLLALRGL